MMSLKNIFKSTALVLVFGGSMAACSDMLDTESTRQNFDPDIDQKTDSLFYSYGIFEAMQHLADQYVFQGEMRGDLVETTQYTDSMLTQLASFTATTANRYDSAYVYYRVINNCNYFITHRKTDLYTGATNVSIQEYAAVKAIRAWAYLQLARNYGSVPFFTEPLTQISQIDDNTFPRLDLAGIVSQLAPDLEQHSGSFVPRAFNSSADYVGLNTVSPNWESTNKTIWFELCYIPVDVILGDLYLEVGNYDKAAQHFVTYLTKVAKITYSYYGASRFTRFDGDDEIDPQQEKGRVSMASWSSIFSRNTTSDIISYIPMAPNAQSGPTTRVPLVFGADYYATPDEQTGYTRRNCKNSGGMSAWTYSLPLVTNVQVVPSKQLKELSDSVDYYYYAVGSSNNNNKFDSIRSMKLGDMRLRNVVALYDIDDNNTQQWITKYDFANVVLYRTSTVLLHLAEAFNRLGMYDVAFAILKDGISEALVRSSDAANATLYMTENSKNLLKTTYPLLKDSFIERFPLAYACGIHCHGAGKAVSDMAETNYLKGKSPYQLEAVVGKKMREVAAQYGVTVGTTKQDTINAVEDLLCDEYALELAFEGNRYYDLMRLARHKNGYSGTQYDGTPASYGASFGYTWLRKKLGAKGWNESNMYLPFE